MTGGSLHEPLFTVAWPGAHLGPMGLEGAVRLGLRKELEAIAEDLNLPQFRVPAPRNSAQHAAATVNLRQRTEQVAAPGRTAAVPQPTRQFTSIPGPPEDEPDYETVYESDSEDEIVSAPTQFAGIDIDEFTWARQQSRRAVVFWVVSVLVLTGLAAVAGWTIGLNLEGLIGR